MENREKAFWEMQNNCLSFCYRNKALWKNTPIVSTLINLMETNNNQLTMALKALDVNDPNGYTLNKDIQLSHFTDKIYRLCRRLSLYAKMTCNDLLLDEVDIQENILYKYSDDLLLRTFTNVLNHANRHIKYLEDYMITAKEVDSLRLELTNLKNMSINQNQLSNKRITTTKSVNELLKEARLLFDRLDDAFTGLILDQTFINKWQQLRKNKPSPIFHRIKKETYKNTIDFNFHG